MGYLWLFSEALHDSWTLVAQKPLVSILATALFYFISLLISAKRGGKEEVRKKVVIVWQGAKLPLLVTLIVFLLYLFFFTPKRLYDDHKMQIDKVHKLEVALKDKTHYIHPEDPAYWNMEKSFRSFQVLRNANRGKACRIMLTRPHDGDNRVADIIYFSIGFLTDCLVTMEEADGTDPDRDAEIMKGVGPNVVIIHTPKDLNGSLRFFQEMESLFSVRRSYKAFPGRPDDTIWLQFGRNVQWNSKQFKSKIIGLLQPANWNMQ